MKLLDPVFRFFTAPGRVDPSKFQPREVIRIRALNIVVVVAIAAFPLPIALMVAERDPSWNESIYISLALLLGLFPILFAHRIGYITKVLCFFVWMFVFVCALASFGRINGTHFILFILPAISLLLLGSSRWILAAFVSTIGAGLFIAIEYLVPWVVNWNTTVWTAIAQNLPKPISFGLHDVFFVSVVVATNGILFAGSYYVLSELRKAEDSLGREHARSEHLLANMLPTSVASRLKDEPGATIAHKHTNVSILFADLVGFTAYSSERQAEEVVSTLNALFSRFDTLAESHNLEKIKTIGDAYMVAGGLTETDHDHPSKIAMMALDMIENAEALFSQEKIAMKLRIGIHSGPVVAGVVGHKRPFYDVWGDTVNVASRMEETANVGTIQVTKELMNGLRTSFEFKELDSIDLKGKGLTERYVLVGRL